MFSQFSKKLKVQQNDNIIVLQQQSKTNVNSQDNKKSVKKYNKLLWFLFFANSSAMLIDQPASMNTHRIEMLLLATLHISAWACLIRSDYNFVFLFFSYFYLISRKDHVSLSILFYLVIGLCVLDGFFFLFVPSTWMAYEQNNVVWNNLHGMHGFAIFCSVLIFVLKLPIIYYLYTLKKSSAPSK